MFAKAAELDPDLCRRLCRNRRLQLLFVPDEKGPGHHREHAGQQRPGHRTRSQSRRGTCLPRAWPYGEPEGHRKPRPNTRRLSSSIPISYEANYFYGRYCRATGRLEQAAELFERAAEVRPADYKAVGLLQSVYELLGRKDAADRSGRRCVERAERELHSRPENAIAAMHAAMALAVLGEKDRSKHFLQLALSTEADDPGCVKTLCSM